MNTTITSEIYLSSKGMKELKRQIDRLERDYALAQQDLRELDKTEGHEERLMRIEKLAVIEVLNDEITEKKFALDHAKLLPRKRDTFKVALGSVVELIDTKGRKVRYMLVDSLEADPSAGRISTKSPLGKNLLGRQIQDIVQWSCGLRTNQLKLVGIA